MKYGLKTYFKQSIWCKDFQQLVWRDQEFALQHQIVSVIFSLEKHIIYNLLNKHPPRFSPSESTKRFLNGSPSLLSKTTLQLASEEAVWRQPLQGKRRKHDFKLHALLRSKWKCIYTAPQKYKNRHKRRQSSYTLLWMYFSDVPKDYLSISEL